MFLSVQCCWSIPAVCEANLCFRFHGGSRRASLKPPDDRWCRGQRSFPDKPRQVATVAGLSERSMAPFRLFCARSHYIMMPTGVTLPPRHIAMDKPQNKSSFWEESLNNIDSNDSKTFPIAQMCHSQTRVLY